MSLIKPVLVGTELDVRASDAQAVVRYLIDADKDASGGDIQQVLSNTPQVLAEHLQDLPAIGDQRDFGGIDGAPLPADSPEAGGVAGGGSSVQYASHKMRVYRRRITCGDTLNRNKAFCDVYYASRGRPVLEMGGAAVQQQTQTYLGVWPADGIANVSGPGSAGQPADSSDPAYRTQMILDWLMPRGVYIPQTTDASGKVTGPWPTEDAQLLKTPAAGSMFRFGSSLKFTSFWFSDEVTITQWNQMCGMFVTAVNQDAIIFKDDAQRWLCTSLPYITTDGGWIYRVSVELVYSPWGWDNYLYYVDPFSQQPAIIKPKDLQDLYVRGAIAPGSIVPGAYAKAGAGVGRFPQQICRPMQAMLGFLSQGILYPQGTIGDVINGVATPKPGNLDLFKMLGVA